ncbi:MAG: DUF4215 domain-containing protein, partial [Deltaproteobacteria bacterium]|nr:DUF4215 domain-containing protein [Deltaproteobacteria bacterium]
MRSKNLNLQFKTPEILKKFRERGRKHFLNKLLLMVNIWSMVIWPIPQSVFFPAAATVVATTVITSIPSKAMAAGCVGGAPNDVLEPGEECDDANPEDTDACLNTCQNATCGDGFVWSGHEVCDDGPLNGQPFHCNASCSGVTQSVCGNGVLEQSDEECDDSNTINGDGCDSQCVIEQCGNGKTQFGEECDDGNPEETDACLTECLNATCGDGFVRSGYEVCDDGPLNGQVGHCSISCSGTTNVCVVDPASPSAEQNLRDAVSANSTCDSVQILPGTITLTSAIDVLDSSKPLLILGAGGATANLQNQTILDGNQQFRIFNVGSENQVGVSLTLSQMVIRNAYTTTYGGAIFVHPSNSLKIEKSIIRDNNAGNPALLSTGRGNAIYGRGNVEIIDTEIFGNFSDSGCGIGAFCSNMPSNGGAIYQESGSLNINRSLIYDNYGGYGSVYVDTAATANITNTTFSENKSALHAGVFNKGQVEIHHSTFYNNAPSAFYANLGITDPPSSSIYNQGEMSLKGVLIADSDFSTDNCINVGNLISQGSNISNDGTCLLNAPTDYPSAYVVLDPLTDNGGFTRTHAIPTYIVGIDWSNESCPPVDQRGITRPQDGNGDGFADCDVGAVEYVYVPPPCNYD